MTGDRLEMTDAAIDLTDAAIEALRRGHAPDGPPLRGQEDADIAAVRVATLLALGAGRGPRVDPAFVARLESDLLARQAVQTAGRRDRRRPTLLPRWPRLVVRAGIALALPVFLALTLLAVRGPRQALADVRRLLSYVPGLGFVATRDARVLAEPVEIVREGVTVRVEQVVAGARDTRVVMFVNTSVAVPNDEGRLTSIPDAGIVLRAPNGVERPLTEWSQRAGGAVLTFGPLPTDADSAVLAMRVPPGLPAGAAPGQEEWALHLSLRRDGEATGDARLVAPYDPGITEQTYHGITLRVLEVAHTAQETVVRVGIDGHPTLQTGMPPRLGRRFLPTLKDDANRSYRAGRAPGVGSEAGAVVVPVPDQSEITEEPPAAQEVEVLAFEPLHPEARELTLTVDGVAVDVPATGEFQIDLGPAPAIGNTFPVDVELQVAGATVRLTGAALVREELALRDGVLVRTLLQFEAEQVTPRSEVIVNSFPLTGDPTVVSGSPSHGGPEGIYSVGVEFRDGRIPPGVLSLSLERVGVMYLGPWEFTWEVPPAARP